MRLTSLDDILRPLLATARPVEADEMPVYQAVGLPLAEAVVARAPVPPRSIALRSGLAVTAFDLVGASMHSPVLLPQQPRFISAGDDLPEGCDAILDPAAVAPSRSTIEITQTVDPGAHVRLVGHDLDTGQLVARADEILTAEAALAASLAGVRYVNARRVSVRLDWPPGPERAWLSQRLQALGVAMQTEACIADLVIAPGLDEKPMLALQPGETAWACMTDRSLHVALPKRFDGMFGGWCGIVLPLLSRLMGVEIAKHRLKLDRKIVSAVGIVEIALLKQDGNAVQFLGAGDITLADIAAADAFAVIPAGSEGIAGGDMIEATLLASPFRSGRQDL